MIKRLSVLSFAAVLALSGAGAASAATKPPQSNDVRVQLDGETVVFGNGPSIIGSTTFADYESVFDLFGYDVSIDEVGVIDAKSELHEIQMAVGGDMAFVDGKAVPLGGQLQTVGDETLIAIRFVAEITGVDIGWDDKTRTVSLNKPMPTAEEVADIYALLEKSAAAQTKEEALTVLTPDSPIRELLDSVSEEELESVVTKTTILEKSILSYEPGSVIVQTKEDDAKVSGGFYADGQSTMQYLLHEDGDGNWGIYDFGIVDVVYKDPSKLFDQAVAAPSDVKSALDAAILARNQAVADEDADAYLATLNLADGEEEADFRELLKQNWAALDNKITVQKSVVVDYDATAGTATLLLDAVSELIVQGQTLKVHSIYSNDAVRKDGKWLLDPNPTLYFQEQL